MLVTPITPVIGAEISDVSLANLSPAEVAHIKELFLKHMVLVFRDQALNREQHKAFGRNFGELHIHPSKRSAESGGMKREGNDSQRSAVVNDDPELFIIDTKPDAKQSNGEAWHYGIRLKPGQVYPKASHPVIPVHPETNRPYLFVNGSFTSHIEGIAKWESDMLLAGLHKFVAASPKFQCRVKWTKDTLTMWDNRCVQHHAIRDYVGYSRYGERVSVLAKQRPHAFLPAS